MTLTKAQIQSIDTYLKNSNIQFVDVRMELVDHVANAVLEKMELEQLSFYDAFKAYMVTHKHDIQKNHDKSRKKNQIRGFGMLPNLLKKPVTILLYGLVYLDIFNFKDITGIKFPNIPVLWCSLVCIALIYFICSIPFKKNRFSGIESLACIIWMAHNMLLLFFNFNNFQPAMIQNWPISIGVLSSSLLILFGAWIYLFFQQKKFYTTQYA